MIYHEKLIPSDLPTNLSAVNLRETHFCSGLTEDSGAQSSRDSLADLQEGRNSQLEPQLRVEADHSGIEMSAAQGPARLDPL